MARPETRQLILDTAERLFAGRGFAAVSLRQIIQAAGVNVAAVHYHFGSKEELLQAVLARRIGPVNQERLALLDACERRAGRRPPRVDRVLEAFVGPAVRLARSGAWGPHFVRVVGRVLLETDPLVQRMVEGLFGEVAGRFIRAFRRALPALPEEELFWRIHFMIGAMAHTLCDTQQLQFISGGRCDPHDVDGLCRRLVAFLAAGLKAPTPRRGGAR